jgi:microcin C transport system permease protein
MIKDYLSFDFGKSYYKDKTVLELIKERLPVSISLGLWSTLIIYLIAIPLGIKKARRDGEEYDVVTSTVIFIGSAIPVFLFAVLLIVLFAGGTYLQIFPLKGLTSDGWETFSLWHKIADYFWHITLPVTCIVIGGIASLTMLTKNSFMDELSKQYVLTARAKGLSEKRILYHHVFRNAMMIIIAGLPGLLMKILFLTMRARS